MPLFGLCDPQSGRRLAEPTRDTNLWETLPVTNASLPEERLREHLSENSLTGECYDYVSVGGAANQQPRRSREGATVYRV